MAYGKSASSREAIRYQWLVLSEKGKSLENHAITERTPTPAELEEAESLSWLKRKRRLRELTTSAIVIKEGLVPYPETHPATSRCSTLERVLRIIYPPPRP